MAEDSSGSGNDGTVYGDAVWEDGVMLGGLNFDGDGDWVDISNPGEYSTEADFTWSGWIRLLDGQVITDGGVIIAKCPATGDYGNGAKCLYVAADGKLEFNVYGVGSLSTETHVNDALWHHVALTVEFETSGSNDTAKLYIDGDLPDDAIKDNWNVNEYGESDALKIGFANNNFPQSPDQTYFYGRIDDVHIYDYVLNANEIGGIFEDSGYWRFVVTCDSRDDSNPDKRDDDDPGYDGVNNGRLQEIADAIIAEKAEFVVFPGDLVTNGTTTELECWRYGDGFGNNLMKDVYDAGITVMPVRGNHESSAANWLTVFADEIPDNGPDEANYGNDEVNFTYYMEHRNAMFIGMDVYKGVRAHNVNQDWLDDVLEVNTRQHVFVFTHEPAFKVRHSDCLDDDADARDDLWYSLEDEPGCRVYFCGHDHFYDRAWIDDSDAETEDVHQMLVGTAGAPLKNDGAYNGDNGEWTPTRIKHEKQYGYVVVEIWGESKVTAHWKHRVDNDPDPATYEPGGDVFEYTGIIPQDTSKFYIKNNSGEAVAWFGNLGNVVLKGTLTTGVDPLEEDPEYDELRVQDSDGYDVAIIDGMTGDMYIKGSLNENQDMSTLSPEGFIIKNSNGDVVAYIDDSGDLYLEGNLYENVNP
ncbi:MAG: metallophosphoesterase [Planctomycetes bacterium]|nr:metallophosphoesterase [Planctomycetota bacterium]